MEFCRELIGPEQAMVMLSSNYDHNRNLNPRVVEAYARDMSQRGAWKFTGDPIRFTETGTLIDGQHRLAAVIKSGATIEFAVVRGLPVDAFDAIDRGKSRSVADALTISGEPNAALIAGAARWVRNSECGRWGLFDKLTVTDVKNILDRHPGIRLNCTTYRGVPGVSPTLSVALHYLMSQKDAALAQRYWARLKDGIGIAPPDPTYAVRRRLEMSLTGVARMREPAIACIVVTGWNALRRGRGLMRIEASSAVPEIK